MGSGDSVVFIGWSLNQHRQIFKGTDTEAFKNVQIVPAVTFDDEDITVYASGAMIPTTMAQPTCWARIM